MVIFRIVTNFLLAIAYVVSATLDKEKVSAVTSYVLSALWFLCFVLELAAYLNT